MEQGQGESNLGTEDDARGHLWKSQTVYKASGNRRRFGQKEKGEKERLKKRKE